MEIKKSKTFKKKYKLTGIGKTIALIGSIASIIGLYYTIPSSGSFSLTVVVHGKEGQDDMILQNQGHVILDIGDSRKEEAINEKGEATFKELPNSYIGKECFLSIDHDQPYFPVNRNGKYELDENEIIYLEVGLNGLDEIKGYVFDFENEQPLDDVRVIYSGNVALSDSFGWFEMSIPEEDQKKFINVMFIKDGYKTEGSNIAPHTGQNIQISLKKNQYE